MFERLDQARSLTGNQMKIIAAAIIGDMLEFFDYFLIGFVLAFIIKPWNLTFGKSAIILLSSGVGAILGAVHLGPASPMCIGRRKVFMATIINFSLASGILAFTPDNGWIYLSVFRFFVGFGVGGLYCVDLPLVQEFVPARMRGFIGGLVTVFIPLGVMIASAVRRVPDADDRLARTVRGRPAAGGVHPGGPRLGAGIAALAARPGPPRGSPPLARLGSESARRSLPLPVRRSTAEAARRGAICSSIRAAWRCPAWPASARRPRPMASAFGRRRCSCCSSA